MPFSLCRLALLARLILIVTPIVVAFDGRPGHAADNAAHFVIGDRVVAPDPGPFTATVNGIGNGARMLRNGSGFEPIIYRNWFIATEDAAHRVAAKPDDLSSWHTLKSGALDGAEVEVLRVEDGALRQVRVDRIAPGGYVASGWIRQSRRAQVIPPDVTSVTVAPTKVPDWQGAYMLQTVGRDGRLSPASTAVSLPAQPVKAKNARPDMPLTRIPRKLVQNSAKIDKRLPAPQGVRASATANGLVELSWRPGGRGIAGYVLSISDTPPEAHEGFHLELEDRAGAPIRAGDLVIVRKRFLEPSLRDMHTSRSWAGPTQMRRLQSKLAPFIQGIDADRSWRLVPHAPDTAVEEPGETFIEVTLPKGAKTAINTPFSGGVARPWYPTLEPGQSYRFEVWLKADRPTTVTFRFIRTGPKGGDERPVRFQVGTTWQKYSARLTQRRHALPRSIGFARLGWKGPGTLGIDNFRIFQEGTPYLDLSETEYARIRGSGISALRTHALIKTGSRSYDLQQLTNPGGVASGTRQQNTLPQTLAIIEKAGINPWLQIEPHLSAGEWLGLIEYLAAPYDPAIDTPEAKPWAAKRHAQGRHAPWTEAFGRIYFELGNETWNALFHPWVFRGMTDQVTGRDVPRGAAYGLYHDHVWQIMRQSPYWSDAGLDEKMVGVLGGWILGNYTKEAAAASATARVATTAPYIGGWEAGAPIPQETPRDFFKMLTHALQAVGQMADRQMKQLEQVNRKRETPVTFGTYEAGPGFVLSGLGIGRLTPELSARQERVKHSMASGTATLDMFLMLAERGATLQNFFTFNAGLQWSSHIPRELGDHAYPAWDLLSLYNRELTGDFLAVEAEGVPRADLEKRIRAREMDGAPLIAAYATRRRDRVTVTVISRLVPGVPRRGGDGVSSVRLDLPFGRAGKVTRHRQTGRYDDDNSITHEVRLVRDVLPAVTDGTLEIEALQPGSTQIFIFEDIGD